MTEYGSIEVAPGVRVSIDAPPNTRVGFSTAKGVLGLFSSLIRLFTKAPCSHVWLLYWDSDFELDMVMEAHTSWRLVPYADFKKKNNIVALFEPAEPIDSGLKEGGRLLGTRYDTEGLIGNLWVILGERLKRRWRNPFRSRRMVFCSEGVARVMLAAGYPGLVGEVHSIRPEHLLALMNADNSKRVG